MAIQREVHPSSEVLKAFGLGKLDDNSSGVVMNHLDQCPDCRKEVAALSGDDFLNRLRQVQSLSGTPAPVRPLAEAAPPKPSAAQTPMPNLPLELASHQQYEIVRELGRGGMGVVYLAKNKLMDRLEVLKVVNKAVVDRPGAVERFLREIRSAAKLNHVNVVTAYSAVQQGELLAFAMEYVEGQDLASLVQSQGPLPIPHACFYIQQAAYGLQHAFEKHMIHRDIKPQNLILAREGRKHIVKVLDFGLAKATREKPDDCALTGEGHMLGTPAYIAPEQSLDAAKADIRADIYSLGCTLYYLLAGRAPFNASNLSAILLAHQMQEAKPLHLHRPEIPQELAAVVAKMMSKSPAQRYQTPLEVVQALAPFVKPGSTKSSPRQSAGVMGGRTAATNAGNEAKKPSEATTPWESLAEDNIMSPASPCAVVGRHRQVTAKQTANKWVMGGGIGMGVLLLALLGMWAAGVFKVKTEYGTIVLENLPAGAEVVVDGNTITLKAGDGKTITITAGIKHQLQVKKEGFKVFGEVVEIDAGESRSIRVSLQSEAAENKPTTPHPKPDAEDKGVVPFFNGKDLSGWEGLPGYWHVEDGALVGRCPPGRPAHTFLISKKTYRDFDLKFQVRRPDGVGNSGVQLRSRINDWNKFTVVGPQCEIDSAENEYPPGSLLTEPNLNPLNEKASAKVRSAYKDADFNSYHIRCVGKHVAIKVNGVEAIDGNFPTLPDEGVIAWQIHGRRTAREIIFRNIEFIDLNMAVSAEGFVPLFNGKDLTGWKLHPQMPGDWRVEQGMLVGRGPMRNCLFSERGDYEDFHFRIETQINKGGNSGQEFRKTFGPQAGLTGYKAQIDNSKHAAKTGSLFVGKGTAEVLISEVLVPVDTWFTQEVIARGNHIVILVNGKKVVDYVDPKSTWRRGHLALQVWEPETVVRFRKIEIKELPAR